jgi:polysaccharide biosynthesis/export protein
MSPPAAARALVAAALVVGSGCQSLPRQAAPTADPGTPRELKKVTMPEYTIEPPDVVQIDLVNATPKSPYVIRSLDAISVRIPSAVADPPPVAGVFPVDPDGTVNLGPPYGSVKVAGLTLDAARKEIDKVVALYLKSTAADVALAQTRAAEQIRGPHLVRPDGTVGLGTYGSVLLVGQTLSQAKGSLETHLSAHFEKPEVSLDVTGYNSKVYYVLFDGGGAGQQVVRMPVTGNETVLDAIGQVSGLPAVSDKHRIWISRPTDPGCPCQILPVDWKGITECGDPRTNHQIFPGDRVFVNSYKLTRFDTVLARILAPAERALGFTLLGAGTVRTLQFQNGNGGGFGGGFGGF